MDTEIKCVFGMILGEIARLQRHLGLRTFPDHEIFGLVKGMESVIDARLKKSWVPSDMGYKARSILDKFENHPDMPLNSFEDIQDDLLSVGIDRSMATKLFIWFKAAGVGPKETLRKLEEGGMDLEIDLDSR